MLLRGTAGRGRARARGRLAALNPAPLALLSEVHVEPELGLAAGERRQGRGQQAAERVPRAAGRGRFARHGAAAWPPRNMAFRGGGVCGVLGSTPAAAVETHPVSPFWKRNAKLYCELNGVEVFYPYAFVLVQLCYSVRIGYLSAGSPLLVGRDHGTH